MLFGKTRMRVLYGLLAVVSLGACIGVGETRFTQKVVGDLRVDGHPAPGVALRLVSAESSCDTRGTALTTDERGAFEIERKVGRGRFAVVTQRDRLCVQERGVWRSVWAGTYGPAPAKVEFACARDAMQDWACTLNGMPMQLGDKPSEASGAARV